ncbi:MAG: hypothetical protein ACYDH0_08935 [Candidatus Aminicenantales bacterium]
MRIRALPAVACIDLRRLASGDLLRCQAVSRQQNDQEQNSGFVLSAQSAFLSFFPRLFTTPISVPPMAAKKRFMSSALFPPASRYRRALPEARVIDNNPGFKQYIINFSIDNHAVFFCDRIAARANS